MMRHGFLFLWLQCKAGGPEGRPMNVLQWKEMLPPSAYAPVCRCVIACALHSWYQSWEGWGPMS